MRTNRVCLALSCCLFLASVAGAQANRKPGLYDVTSTMTFQQSPLPPGMQAPPGSPFSGAPRTTQVCVTQAMVDKYGGPSPAPQNRGADCQVTDVVVKDNGMTANISCTGQMTGTGTVESTWTEGGATTSSTVHIKGTVQH